MRDRRLFYVEEEPHPSKQFGLCVVSRRFIWSLLSSSHSSYIVEDRACVCVLAGVCTQVFWLLWPYILLVYYLFGVCRRVVVVFSVLKCRGRSSKQPQQEATTCVVSILLRWDTFVQIDCCGAGTIQIYTHDLRFRVRLCWYHELPGRSAVPLIIL